MYKKTKPTLMFLSCSGSCVPHAVGSSLCKTISYCVILISMCGVVKCALVLHRYQIYGSVVCGCYRSVDHIVQDLVLCDRHMLQNNLKPHGHHTSHPVHQAGTHVSGHPPLKQQNKPSQSSFYVFLLINWIIYGSLN